MAGVSVNSNSTAGNTAMLQYLLIKRFSGLLRWYRSRLTIDMQHLSRYIPKEGRMLDVGCGVGSVDYEFARSRPDLHIHGIDIAAKSIELANRYNRLPNTRYTCQPLESVAGRYDCVLFMDVFHHVAPANRDSLLQAASRLLNPQGYVLIKDIERRRGGASWMLDRYVSRCSADEIFLENCSDLADLVAKHLTVLASEVRFRMPFPHYYIKATAKTLSKE
ncbi:MAG: class I SAM-dependent methyltransferase [Rhodopirellula sp.]|nr:class I SAM-dependent methyltransferase [Rhodopirellula sp.]